MTRRKSIYRTLAVLLALSIAAASAYALFRYRRPASLPDLPSAQARKGEFLVIVRCRGELKARRSVQLTTPTDITDLQIIWSAPPGSEVKAGDVVVRFDPSKTKQDLDEKKAALTQAQAKLDQAIAQDKITADQDKLDLAKARYDREKASLEASKQAIVSTIQGRESAIDLETADEKVRLQQSANDLHVKSGEAKIASLTRLRDQARQELAIVQAHLAGMEVKSPLNGIIVFLTIHTQGWMNAQPYRVGDHVFPGAAIAEIPDLSTLEMEGKVEETDRGRISLGDQVRVHVDAFPEQPITAKLTSISPLTEQTFDEWPPTHSFRAYASLQNPDPRLRPGMNAGADIVESTLQNAIAIPTKALFTDHGKPIAYVKSKNGYEAKFIRIRAQNPDEAAVEGVDPGATIALADPKLVTK